MAREEVTVMVVEDQEGLAEAYAAVLSTKFSVRTAFSGQEALDTVDEDVDVILLDRRMPGMSGDEVLEALTDRNLDARVAMLTAVEPTGNILDMPFDSYVTKPIDNDELVGLVDQLLSWNNYCETTREYFRLAAKKTALETAAKERTDEYTQITERMGTLCADVEGPFTELSNPSDIPSPDQF